MADKEDYIQGESVIEGFRYIENLPYLPPDQREAFKNALDEMEWVTTEDPDAPMSMLEARAETWEEDMNRVLSQIGEMGKLHIYFDDEEDLIIDQREE